MNASNFGHSSRNGCYGQISRFYARVTGEIAPTEDRETAIHSRLKREFRELLSDSAGGGIAAGLVKDIAVELAGQTGPGHILSPHLYRFVRKFCSGEKVRHLHHWVSLGNFLKDSARPEIPARKRSDFEAVNAVLDKVLPGMEKGDRRFNDPLGGMVPGGPEDREARILARIRTELDRCGKLAQLPYAKKLAGELARQTGPDFRLEPYLVWWIATTLAPAIPRCQSV